MPDKSNSERRTSKRYAVTIDIEWECSGERHSGTIGDLSEGGCFVLTGIAVERGEEVVVILPIEDQLNVRYAGTVVNHVEEIGFAVQFKDVTKAHLMTLQSFLKDQEGTAD